MKNLRFICCQPRILYYAWQVEVMINNFIEMDVNPNQIHILVATNPNDETSSTKNIDVWNKLVSGYKDVRFFFYEDTRKLPIYYISSIRPNILKQHFSYHKYLQNETIFYHDCDIAFTKPTSEWITDEMINDKNWYGSDCRWYISYEYIISKGEDVLDKMCEIVKIHKNIVKENELNGIGAQYIMKNLSSEYWEMVEEDCERLFYEINKLSHKKKELNPEYHELQIWCADMWAVLWNAWKWGYNTICHKNLEFSWATSPENVWNRMNIFHNAGAINNMSGLFFKSDYATKFPYNEKINIKEGTTSYEYWKLVQKTGKKTVLI